MIVAADVCGIVVTRGDVPIKRVLEPLAPLGDLVIWDNSQREDLAVYGRYAAIDETDKKAILVVDDDVALHPGSVEALLASYRPGTLVANMPEQYRRAYPSSALVGFGAIFDRDLPQEAFKRVGFDWRISPSIDDGAWTNYTVRVPGAEWTFADAFVVRRTCDVIFSALTVRRLVDVPFEHLPHTWSANRMFRTVGNTEERTHMLDLARKVLRTT